MLASAAGGCAPLGLVLPYDDAPPAPEGGRIKTSLAWISANKDEENSVTPEGSLALEAKRIAGKPVWQQVRHLNTPAGQIGDSVLLDRVTLRPIATWRWTPAGTYITKYNHREVQRIFRPRNSASSVRRVETEDVEPYSALGMEIVVASLPLHQGYTALVPVIVDTVPRGWSWLKITVLAELSLVERSDLMPKDTWVVDCTMDNERTRLFVAMDGRSVRKMQKLDANNEVISVLRRVLISLPQPATESIKQ
ncbi:MAG TPA: hypothetical protein VHW65_11505 [Gemmatimonadales bacterium]|jgi:hypothetical protein|nr:hypothetical protein [Gemmatimonadales bacterium]